MPCRDVDEILTLTLDGEDRLHSYRLSKRTCGAIVGAERLLLDWLGGRTARDIIDASQADLEERYRVEDDERAFLYFKHLFALRDALASVLGRSGDDTVTVESVEVDPADRTLRVRAIVEVAVMTERIRSCGGCGTCGTRGLEVLG